MNETKKMNKIEKISVQLDDEYLKMGKTLKFKKFMIIFAKF